MNRISSIIALVLGLGLLLPTLGTAAGKDATIRISYGNSLCHAPLHVGIEKDFFKNEGLNFEAIKVENAVINEAIGTGQIDAGFGLIGKFVHPLENGLAIRMTSGIHHGCIKLLAPRGAGINSVADLRGKRIGVPGLADSATIVAKRSLAQAGVGFNPPNADVQFVVFSGGELPMALERGAVDAIALSDPGATVAEQANDLVVVINTTRDEKYHHEYCCVSFVTAEFAEKHPEVAAAFTRAIQKASLWIVENPAEAAALQIDKKYVAGDKELNAALLDSYNYSPSVKGGLDALRATAKEMQEIGILRPDTDIEKLVERSYFVVDDVPRH